MNNEEMIVLRLIELSNQIQPRDLFPTLLPEASELIEKNSFAFLLGAVLDRGTKSEVLYTVPYWLYRRFGRITPELIHQLTVDDLRRILQTFPIKPRYLNAAAQTIKDVSELVVTKFNGHAEKIWLNQTALEVESVLRQISNVGPGLASMIVILLERCFKVQFSDHQVMDIKPDVNFTRVFFRLGLIDEMETRKALKKARELHPEYPGELDPAAWWIGKKYCLPKKPMCLDCPLLDLCQFTIGGEHEKNNRNRSGKIVE